MIQEHLNGESTRVERPTSFQQDSSPIRLRSLKQNQLSPSYKSPKSQTPSNRFPQSPPPSSNSKRIRANHARCQAFEKSPDLRMQKVSSLENKENQEMEISPQNNETILSPPRLTLSKSGISSGFRKPLSPISPQMMEDSPVETLKRKTPNRYSPYLLKSALKNANSPRNASPLIRVANSKRKSPNYNRSTPNQVRHSTYSNNNNLMSESPDGEECTIQLASPPTILDSVSQKKFIEESNTIRVKPIQFQAPTSSANEPFSPIAQPNRQATSSSFRSPFKTPSYMKKRLALAEDLGMAFEDSYSRSAKKNPSIAAQLKNPFTPNSFKQIKVIPDKAFRMMVGNTPHQQHQTIVEEPKKKKSIIRSMRDYRRNKKETLKSKLRGDSPTKDYSSSTDSLKKSRSPARKRKFDETEEDLQGGATVLSNLGVLIDQSTITAPSCPSLIEDSMLAADVEIVSDGEDVVIDEVEHVSCESPTKKIKSEQGRPLWSRLKKALTKKKSNPEEIEESKQQQPKNTLRRKLSKKGLQAFKSNQSVQPQQNNLSNPNLLSFTEFNNDGPLRKQRSFGENYFSSMVNGRKQQEEHSNTDLHNISFDETDLNKHKNRQFQLQDDLQEQFLNNMKMIKHTDSNLQSSFTNNTTIAATTNECVKNFKIPSLNLKNVPTLQLAPKEEKASFTYGFVETINTPHHREYFTKHCINEYNSENIEFWCAVRLGYAFMRDRSQRYQMAIKLLNEYVDLSSDKALNIDKKSILQVKTRINDETDDLADLFDSITNHVETVMLDSFKRFQLLPIYQEMICHHKTILTENNKTDLDTPRGSNFKNKMFSFLSPKGHVKQQQQQHHHD